MMNNNKILTVSYGTFSCTLEGFDDSFGTMKAIAEYFRDLAADDRYFGAEPPQPDAEMLARIAQKEVSRRVEAREQDGKIVLSALEDDTSSRGPATVAAPALAAGEVAVTSPVAEVSTDEVEKPLPQTTEAELQVTPAIAEEETAEDTPITIDTAPDPVAPEAEPMPDVVIEESASEAALEEDDADSDAIEADMIETAPAAPKTEAPAPLPVEEMIEDEAEIELQTAFVEDENDIVPGQPDAEVEAFFANSVTDHPANTDEVQASTPQPAPAPAAEQAPAPDSIAAKLQRIRAVVAQHEEKDEDADYLEDEHADAASSEPSELIADARQDIEDALESDDAAQAADDALAIDTEEEASDEDDVSAILSRLEAETTDPQASDTAEDVADSAQDDGPTVAAQAALADADEALEAAQTDIDDPSVEDTVSNLFDEDESTLDAAGPKIPTPKVVLRKPQPVEEEAVAASDPQVAVTAEDTPAEAAAQAPRPAPRARVIKVKRADLEAAIEQGDLEEYDDEDDDLEATEAQATEEPQEPADDAPLGLDDLAPARSKTTTLSPEEEDELARELAALKEDIAAGDAKETDAAPQAQAPAKPDLRIRSGERRALPSIDETNGSDVNRLLAETDHQMDEPESATRRDAFAHLRAAVAAKKADAAAGAPTEDGETDDAYRSDLAEVVRPRRPVSKTGRTERPSDARPAPLKLVAEQRVDVDSIRPAGPVRPRRVAANAEPVSQTADGESFTDFATEMGATSLPQLLEAAAAYMSFVEGREQFSRPQLMTKVRQAGGDEGFSREEGLRSFGQLLRTGKIEKIKGGRFTVSEDIGYRPDQRAAG